MPAKEGTGNGVPWVWEGIETSTYYSVCVSTVTHIHTHSLSFSLVGWGLVSVFCPRGECILFKRARSMGFASAVFVDGGLCVVLIIAVDLVAWCLVCGMWRGGPSERCWQA